MKPKIVTIRNGDNKRRALVVEETPTRLRVRLERARELQAQGYARFAPQPIEISRSQVLDSSS